MAKESYSARQIAAHFAQGYLDRDEDPNVVRDFSVNLGKRLPQLKKQGDSACYHEMGSLLYCVNDMKDSCREAAIASERGEMHMAGKKITLAARRVREIGTPLTEIRSEHPAEFEKTCKGFVESWKDTRFDRGGALLQAIENSREEKMAEKPFQPSLNL